MKAILFSIFFIISISCVAQKKILKDTNTYTFKIAFDEPVVESMPCGYVLFKISCKYKVLETNFPNPLKQICIIHVCSAPSGSFKGSVYTVKGQIDFVPTDNRYYALGIPVLKGTNLNSID